MLAEFKVSNFRSIKEIQTLSMVASKDKSLLDSNCIETEINAIPQLVKSAVMYGANASGKSNLIHALAFMRAVVENSFARMIEGQKYNISPFRFESSCSNQPSEFEVTFIEEGVRYQYGFALTADRIIREWFLAYPKTQPQRWFEREYDEKEKTYKWHFGSHLSLQKNLIDSWKEQTRSNALFLSTAVQLNSEQLRPFFNWFVNKLVIVPSNSNFGTDFTVNYAKSESKKSKIIKYMQAADLGIVDFNVEIIKGKKVNVQFGEESITTQKFDNADLLKITFFHEGKNKSKIGVDYGEESHGTQRFFGFIGPLSEVLENGRILIIDELDSSFHTLMVRFLIKLFHSKLNTNKAQLFFSTHNTSLLDPELFRRDQIWFIEKDTSQESHLYPLTDFSPRKGEALEKGYLLGRYGALPFFGDLRF